MNTILIAVISVAVLGLVCGIMLAVASKVMAVKEDERFPAIRECLPGANCGACGYAGCDGYAKALASGSETRINLCVPGASATVSALSDVLGVESEEKERQVAVVRCRGTKDAAEYKAEYEGILSCAAAKMYYGGEGKCIYRCLGYGDCAKVCPEDAICLENGIAHVDPRVCIGCGLCRKECPNGIIQLVPVSRHVMVLCRNRDRGAATRKECKNGCIGCMKCVKTCEHDAIHVTGNLAEIDYDKCVGCGKCAEVCTTGCIVSADLSQIK